MFLFRSLAAWVLLMGLLPGVDATLAVGASGGSGTITYVWSLVAKPTGATDPQLIQVGPTPTGGATDTAIARFASGAVPGVYRFQVVVSDGTTTLAPSVTEITVQSAQTITFPALTDRTPLDTAPINTGASASSGLPVTLASDNLAVATIVNGQVQLTGALGTATITASQAGSATIAAATPVSRPITVRKVAQVITFGNLAPATVGDPDRALGATASSGLAVTYTSLTPTVATIVNGQLRVIAAGTVVIRASQAGDAVWAAATPVERTLTVGSRPTALTITLPARANPSTLVLP